MVQETDLIKIFNQTLKPSQITEVNPIFIDNDDPNHNWTKFATEHYWCTGSGTSEDPYLIEFISITGQLHDSSIEIRNSNEYFVLRHCFLTESIDMYQKNAVIKLYNVNNSEITDIMSYSHNSNGILLINSHHNYFYSNNFDVHSLSGMCLIDSTNNIIHLNSFCHNNISGIELINSQYNTFNHNFIWENKIFGINLTISDSNELYFNEVESNPIGVSFFRSNNTQFNNNIVDWNNFGIFVNDSYGNKIEKNNVEDNIIGITILESYNNSIIGNTVKDNDIGLFLLSTNTTKIFDNMLIRNDQIGIILDFSSCNNRIYRNCFIGNYFQGTDYGILNIWDDGNIGNYWDDYDGEDEDGDGIGDIAYLINGTANSQDNFPLMRCILIPIPPEYSVITIILTLVFIAGALGIIVFFFYRRRRST
ncbi:MAG: nitrous oxide reductase family maturation protein NosD [Promethearchaeota archaeon]